MTQVWIKQLASLSTKTGIAVKGSWCQRFSHMWTDVPLPRWCSQWSYQLWLFTLDWSEGFYVLLWLLLPCVTFTGSHHHQVHLFSDCHLRLYMLNFLVSVFGIGWCHKGKILKKKKKVTFYLQKIIQLVTSDHQDLWASSGRKYKLKRTKIPSFQNGLSTSWKTPSTDVLEVDGFKMISGFWNTTKARDNSCRLKSKKHWRLGLFVPSRLL